MSLFNKRVIGLVAQAAAVLFIGSQTAYAESTLERVTAQGQFVCGASGQKPGLALINSNGEWSGFDVDICRAISAAVFGDPSKVEFVPTSWPQVFTSLQSGAVDVMNRNATFTVGRDTALGFDFAPVFYSGQGFMVRKDLGATSVDDLAGRSFCVLSGSGQELTISDHFKRLGVPIELVGFESYDVLYPAFEAGRCDVASTEPVGLVGQRGKFANPDDFVIMNELISKEPIGPMVRHGDNQWADIVRTVTFVLMAAEEHGITSENIDQVIADIESGQISSGEIPRLLGFEGELGSGMGLTNDYAVNVIKSVGNYAEIWDRNFGPDTKTFLPRGLNTLWNEGGMLYAPPFR